MVFRRGGSFSGGLWGGVFGDEEIGRRPIPRLPERKEPNQRSY